MISTSTSKNAACATSNAFINSYPTWNLFFLLKPLSWLSYSIIGYQVPQRRSIICRDSWTSRYIPTYSKYLLIECKQKSNLFIPYNLIIYIHFLMGCIPIFNMDNILVYKNGWWRITYDLNQMNKPCFQTI